VDERDSASAPTAVERPGASSPETLREPSSPVIRDRPSTVDGTSGSAFDPPRDRFETKSELGRGGMGRVDEAYDRALGRPVAIKHMLSPGGTELARFEREARITARLEHPGIVPIHDAGRSPDGTPYYVMRRIDGQPLSDMTAGKTLDERLALVPNLLAACDAAGFAHARGVVHRDIKPTNILIGPFGETLLIDWGLARELDDRDGGGSAVIPSQPELTRAGTVAGTPGFMSPEQARGESVDARADVYALGVTLFYVLTGKLPWGSASATEMVNVVGAGRAPSWELLPEDVPDDLRAVLEKAMATEPEHRYADGSALAADLRRFITGNLVGARHYGRFARFLRFVQRHRAVMAVAAISLVIVTVVAVISVRRVIVERDDARAARSLAEQREREMADSADALLVDNARQLAEKNPIAAIAKLRTLRPESKRWREAWVAASAAWFNGIPFGFVNEHGPAVLETATDNRHVLITNQRTGTLVVVDLIARTRREVAKLGRAYRCVWLDAGKSIVCQRQDDSVIVDVASGLFEPLGFATDNLSGDRGSRVMVRNRETRQLVEIRPGSKTPTVILDDIDDFTASADLEWLVVRRRVDHFLQHGQKRWMLPWKLTATDSAPIVDVRDGIVTAILEKELKSLQVVDDKLVERATTPRSAVSFGVASSSGHSFAIDFDGVRIVDMDGRYTPKKMRVRGYYSTRRGFIVHGADGEIVLRDALGWFELGRRPLTYRSLDQSPDGRFVTAIADSGDLLAWDLFGPRGQVIELDRSEMPKHIDDQQVWLIDAAGSILFRNLKTGERRELVKYLGPTPTVVFDPYGRFVSVTETDDSSTYVYDALSGSVRKIDAPLTNVSIDEVGMAYVLRDRTVWRWKPGTPEAAPPVKIGQFPLQPSFVAVAGDYAVGVASPRELMRLDTRSGQVERAVVEGNAFQVAVEASGRSWILNETHAWRWDVDAAAPIRLESPEPYTQMTALRRGVLLASSKSLTMADGDKRRILATSVGRYVAMDDELLASLSPTLALSVIDLKTAQRIDLPLGAMTANTLVAFRNRFGTVTGLDGSSLMFTYWDLDVPRDPVELQKWLATITNAKPIPDSDAVAWPSN